MPRNDPTDTGGLFIGRRPGTAPLRLRARPSAEVAARRRGRDRALAALLLGAEAVLLLSLWGPQPAAWLWVGSQVNYLTGSVVFGIASAFAGMMVTLFVTLALAKRLDHMWKLVRRASGHEQRDGALERIFAISAVVVLIGFLIWLFVLAGPGSNFFPKQAP